MLPFCFQIFLSFPMLLEERFALMPVTVRVLIRISVEEIERLRTDDVLLKLNPVLQTVGILRSDLPDETTLLGFCGAPWTVATYMIAGQGTPDQAPARLFALEHPESFERLLDIIAECSADYLIAQLKAGADAVQIFDSWASVLDEDQFERWCVKPVTKIVARVRETISDAPIIGFPKGIGAFYETYRAKTAVNMLGLDWSMPMSFARKLQQQGAVQGNLDPMRLIAGGRALDEGIDADS